MRVLFVNENIGGHTTVHVHLERELRAFPDIHAEFLHVPPRRGLRRLMGAQIPGLGRLDLDLQPLRAQLALSRWVDRRVRARMDEFDVIHVYTQNAALASPDILRRRPSLVSVDSTNELNAFLLPQRRPTKWTKRLLPITLRFERRVFDAATLVVSSSEYAARSLRSTYSVPPERLRILPMGIPVPANIPERREPALPNPPLPKITFVGRTLERKGGNRLLALHQARFAERCVLVLVTKEPVDALPNVEVFNDIEVGDPRLEQILLQSAAFVFPSEIDQSPNAVLEAMAMGVPVIASNVGALPEMVDEGVTGVLVPPDDTDALGRAIELVLDDPARRERMGVAGRARAIERYDVHRTTALLVDLLREAQQRFDQR